MYCPNCGAPEQVRVRVCQACGAVYTSADLLQLRKLEFLLKETADWPESAERRQLYAQALTALQARILPSTSTPAPPTEQAELRPEIAEPAAQPALTARQDIELPAVARAEVETPPRPQPAPVPFDQWLLSERNIKIALYSGGLLLVLAGLIFVGINWTRLPGPAKFAITLMITGILYLGGYVLFQRPTLRLGGVALLAVSSGFVPLNFIVLQLYIFGPQGLNNNMMWFGSSLPILLLYVLTAYWTRADLFTYLSVAAIVSAVTAALVLLSAPVAMFALVYSMLGLAFLMGTHAFQSTQWAGFTRRPLLIVSQIAAPILFVAGVALWVIGTGCASCRDPWLALAAMALVVLFYVATDRSFGWLAARWAGAFMFALTVIFLLTQLRLGALGTGLSLELLALVYLGVGYQLERQAKRRPAGWPLYAAGYAVAAFVTLQGLSGISSQPDNLALALVADVILLAVSARVHHDYKWVYGAAWLFIVPVLIEAWLRLPGPTNVGLALGVLMLNYVAAGYALGRRALKLGGPFLTAATFLSLSVAVLSWTQPTVATAALVVIAALYVFIALWLAWSWLLLPALVAVNLGVLSFTLIFFVIDTTGLRVLTLGYAALGVALTLGAAALRRGGQKRWAWPLYLVAAFDLAMAFGAALLLDVSIAIGLSASLALLALWFAWFERDAFVQLKLPPLLAYLGAVFIFVGHLNILRGLEFPAGNWPALTAGLCALFVAVSWMLRREPLTQVFGTPMHRSGLALMVLPLAATVVLFQPIPAAVTFAIAGTAFAADGAVRRILSLAYLAGGSFVAVIWALLFFFKVSEPQTYVVPLGLGLVALGWNERRLGSCTAYLLATRLGLVILMGSAFLQSLGAASYALLLLVESLVALAWGVRMRSRGYVELALMSLILNAVAQLGPAFAALDRWIQIGAIGSLLLGGGLVALFQRDQILQVRQTAANQWKEWQV